MKKVFYCTICFVILLIGSYFVLSQKTSQTILGVTTVRNSKRMPANISVRVTTLQETRDFVTKAKTALEALSSVAQKEQFLFETKTYPFGTLVTSVDGFSNTSDHAWVYFVNGKTGDVGADSYQLHPGDVVEWKYASLQ